MIKMLKVIKMVKVIKCGEKKKMEQGERKSTIERQQMSNVIKCGDWKNGTREKESRCEKGFSFREYCSGHRPAYRTSNRVSHGVWS